MIRDTQREVDVVIIGAGPAGSTAAALLAERGWNVRVIEKSYFPRYHVGESLIPYCWFTLNRLGVTEKLNQIGFTRKHSVQFVRPDGKLSAPFYFRQHREHPSSSTWQVYRARFDRMLVDNAMAKGAVVRFGTLAKALIEEDGQAVGVEVESAQRGRESIRARLVIDASGRDMFTISRKDWRTRDPKLNKISIWTYYKSAMRDPGIDEGATTVASVPDKGWFWYIPLMGDVVSVGLVAERDYLYREGVKDPAKVFAREIEQNQWIKQHVGVGRQVGRFWVTGDYCYRARHCASDGLLLIGDAFAFLDPVFSSGVLLALKSGEFGADAADAALIAGDTSSAAFADYGRTMCEGIEAMRKLVYAFYDRAFSFGKVIRAHPDVLGDLTDCLIGDLFGDFQKLNAALAEFAELPVPLEYGKAEVTQA